MTCDIPLSARHPKCFHSSKEWDAINAAQPLHRKSRPRVDTHPLEQKLLWEAS